MLYVPERKTKSVSYFPSRVLAAGWRAYRKHSIFFHRLGFRLVGISHGEGRKRTIHAAGNREPLQASTASEREDNRKNSSGLTPFGFEVLKAENELGIVTDLSHINDRAFFDVMEHSTLPPIMSHTAVFSLCHQSPLHDRRSDQGAGGKRRCNGNCFRPTVHR